MQNQLDKDLTNFLRHYDEMMWYDGTKETEDPLSKNFNTREEMKKYVEKLPEGHIHGDIGMDALKKRIYYAKDEDFLGCSAKEIAGRPYDERVDAIKAMKRKLALYYDLMPIIRRNHVELLHSYCREIHGHPCIETQRLYAAYDELPFRAGL